MKIGLYFGSFNPIHIGHLIIATHVLNVSEIDKVWFLVSPLNPQKIGHGLLNEYNRLHLVRLAIDEEKKFRASDVEFKLARPSFTIDTITYLKEKYIEHQFAILMGSDSFQNLSKWKNYEQLVLENEIIVYRRPGFEDIEHNEPNIRILNNTPLVDISATNIRKLIKLGKSIRYMVTDAVKEEIEKCGYYK